MFRDDSIILRNTRQSLLQLINMYRNQIVVFLHCTNCLYVIHTDNNTW